jgi:hypothetical protein
MSRKNGTFAVGISLAEGRYILNTGEAYGGELFIRGPIRLRLSKGRNELPMLREHDRTRIIGAWTGVAIEGRSVVASGIRWAETADAQESKSLVDGGFVHAASIGFSAQWTYREEMKPAELDAVAREGADLARLRHVLTDVEVYEASLVAVGADGNARWNHGIFSEGEDHLTLSPAAQLMVAHLQREHGMTLGEALVAVVAPVAASEAPEAVPAQEADGALYDVPDAIQAAAQQGLDWREEYGRGGTASGVRTARALVAGSVSAELAVTISAWWARFSQVEGPMKDEQDRPTNLAIARALWGGDDAQAWADRLRDEVEGEEAALAAVTLSREGGSLHLLPPPATGPEAGWWLERLPARAGEVKRES